MTPASPQTTSTLTLSLFDTTPNPTPLLPSPPRPIPPAVKRLTPEEIATRSVHGLCFNCDERYHWGHRCSSRIFLLISEDDDPSSVQIPQPNPQPEPETPTPDPIDPYPAQISFNSLAGNVTPETLRFMGTIGNRHVVLLVDGGSTHNFIQHQLVSQLSLIPRTTTPLCVMVGNEQQLECTSVCESVPVTIQATEFIVDLHVLPIAGANVVLGVQWLKSLGPVLTDYNSLCMKFFHAGTFVELQGGTETTLNSLSSSQFHRLLHNQPESLYFHVDVLHDDNSMVNSDIDPVIQELINRFHPLFQAPEKLPPARPTDHRIHLVPNATPVNVRPYRYPHFQKQEIETQVKLMHQKGLIQPSNSPFSSPVLLVKKHDGTWHFCVDYRALNSLTMKDRFSLPTIDELLDELGDARYFSKLDLLQGYHQIRMHSGDISKTAFRTHHGHYEFRVMPFGLCNAPSSFQATMNSLFRPYLHRFIIVFFDDILIYSTTFAEHLTHLEVAFQVLLSHQFVLKLSKCFFAQAQVEYLGHMVSFAGVQPVPSKISAIQQWPIPQTTRAVRSFLGLAGFYRCFSRAMHLSQLP